MKTVELLREGEWTDDRRLVADGATTWPESIPLMSRPDEVDSSIILGYITNIRREGNRIVGDSNVPVEAVSVGGRVNSDGGQVFSSYELAYALPCTQDQYMWNDSTHD